MWAYHTHPFADAIVQSFVDREMIVALIDGIVDHSCINDPEWFKDTAVQWSLRICNMLQGSFEIEELCFKTGIVTCKAVRNDLQMAVFISLISYFIQVA